VGEQYMIAVVVLLCVFVLRIHQNIHRNSQIYFAIIVNNVLEILAESVAAASHHSLISLDNLFDTGVVSQLWPERKFSILQTGKC
jgi:hypothetical protein